MDSPETARTKRKVVHAEKTARIAVMLLRAEGHHEHAEMIERRLAVKRPRKLGPKSLLVLRAIQKMEKPPTVRDLAFELDIDDEHIYACLARMQRRGFLCRHRESHGTTLDQHDRMGGASNAIPWLHWLTEEGLVALQDQPAV